MYEQNRIAMNHVNEISKDYLYLTNGQWDILILPRLKDKQKHKEFIESLTQLNAQNHNAPILVQVIEFQFINLKILRLMRSQIQTIQPIQNSKFPLLEDLNLSQNHITSLKPLRRANFPSIHTLDLYQNRLRESVFPLAQLFAPKLTHLSFEISFFDNDEEKNPNLLDIMFLINLQSNSIKYLFCSTLNRIKQRQDTTACLKRRYFQVKF